MEYTVSSFSTKIKAIQWGKESFQQQQNARTGEIYGA